MQSIRSLLAAVFVATTLAGVAAPALAQPEWNINGRIDQIAERINRMESHGRLGHRDAREAREELQGIRNSEARMRRDGRLDRRERENLERRLDRLDKRVVEERR